jgi:hypothetical protein
MIVSATFIFFGIDNYDLADRLTYIETMFLTGQFFQVVAQNETPSLGYLTMMDYFLVTGSFFIYVQLIFATFIRFQCESEDPLD